MYPNYNLETINSKLVGFEVLASLIKLYNFSNNMTIKELKEEIHKRAWIDIFNVKFRVFKVINDNEVIGKITVASYDIPASICNDTYTPPMKKLAVTFCNINKEKYSRKEGKTYALHRLLCDEPGIETNSKYTKLDNDFIKNTNIVLPFQAYVEDVPGVEHQIELIKEAIIKSANSMCILWMNGITIEYIK